jgi:hypothetical protein
MTRLCVLSSVICLLLASCAKPPTADHAAMSATNEAVRVCREYNAVIERAELIQYASLPATERTFALMHRETMSMIKSTWGKDECTPGTNQWDAWAAYYAGHAEEVDSVVGLFRTLGIAAAAGWAIDNLTSAMAGTTITVNGDENAISRWPPTTPPASTRPPPATPATTTPNGRRWRKTPWPTATDAQRRPALPTEVYAHD